LRHAARRAQAFGVRVDHCKPRLQLRQRFRVHQLALADDQPVRQQGLPVCRTVVSQCGHAKLRIDYCDQCIETEAPAECRRFGKQLQDRAGFGQTAGFDNHPLEPRVLAQRGAALELQQGHRQIGAHLAADAAAGQQHHVFAGGLDQIIVDADGAELVDHHRHVGEHTAQCGVEQACLAGTQRTAQYRHRNRRATLAAGW